MMPTQKKITGSYRVRKTPSQSVSPSKRYLQDENYNGDSKDLNGDASSSPSKRTKNENEVTSPSVWLKCLPLSPRKDSSNVQSPVCQSWQPAAPNTLPRTITHAVRESKTRRNLSSSFANLSTPELSFQQKCTSSGAIDGVGRIQAANSGEKSTRVSAVEPSKITLTPSKCTSSSTETNIALTPSKCTRSATTPLKHFGGKLAKDPENCDGISPRACRTPPKSHEAGSDKTARAVRSTATPSKPVVTSSKRDTGTLRLVKENGDGYQRMKSVLHTSLPSDSLVGRQSQSKVIDDFLNEHLSKMVPGSMYVSGHPGTGKTAVLRTSIDRIQAGVTERCKVAFINCMSLRNAHNIHRTVLSSLLDKPVTSSSAKQAATDLERYVTTHNYMILLVLDEMDSLDCKSQEILYTLFELPALPDSKLILIGIANSLDLTDRILPRLHLKTQCRPRLLNFPPYGRDEIAAILNSRMASAADEGGETVLESSAVQLCARKVAAVSGDVRTALDVCRRAVEVVESHTCRQLRLGSESPSKSRGSPAARCVGLKDVLKVMNEVMSGGSRLVAGGNASASAAGGSVQLPLQQTVAICTLLMMTGGDSGQKSKLVTHEVTLGKFHESFGRVCCLHGIPGVDQSEFLNLCQRVESCGIFSLKKSRDTRSTKVCLKMLRGELEAILQDKTLMSSILQKGVPK